MAPPTSGGVADITVRDLYKNTLQTAIDIINESSELITNRDTMTPTAFRRSVFQAFTNPERRIYVGIWLIVISFVLYFIDSAA